jgi:flavin reductase (DIM6/NTAB) family NADH-FMN oxidoreductase RutF
MDITLDALSARDRYALMTSVVVPRPIAWVTTKDAQGHTNLAPFSYFSGLGSDPAMITLGIALRIDGSEKDTLRIARETGCFCINLVEETHIDLMNQSSADYPADTSEIDALSLETLPCTAIDGVRLACSRAALECKLVDVHIYGRRGRVGLVVAEIVHAWVDEAVVDEAEQAKGRVVVDPKKISPLSRLGGENYAGLGARTVRARPRV